MLISPWLPTIANCSIAGQSTANSASPCAVPWKKATPCSNRVVRSIHDAAYAEGALCHPLPPDTLLKPSDVTLSLEPPIGRGGGGNFAFVFLLPLLAHSLPTPLALRTCTPHLGTHALFPACDLCIWLGQIFQGIYGDIRVALKENLNFRKRVNETMEIVGCGG